tara:strand:+ start:63 stop:269 length:207 start_codon:yes stop_codon:yes gene_type:complete
VAVKSNSTPLGAAACTDPERITTVRKAVVKNLIYQLLKKVGFNAQGVLNSDKGVFSLSSSQASERDCG